MDDRASYRGGSTPQERWARVERVFDLVRDFGLAHGKKLAFPEWGIWTSRQQHQRWGGGDNPYHVQQVCAYAKDPAKCHAYVAGLDTTNLVADLAPTLEREQQITTDVIQSSAQGRRQPPQQTAVAGDLERLWLSMAEWFGSDVSMLEHPTDPGVDPKKYCEMTYAMYKGALRLPQPRAARLLKFILGPEAAK